jgi:hypothetical protein
MSKAPRREQTCARSRVSPALGPTCGNWVALDRVGVGLVGSLIRRGVDLPHMDRGGRGGRLVGLVLGVQLTRFGLEESQRLAKRAGRVGQLIASEHQDHHDSQDQPVSRTEIRNHLPDMQLSSPLSSTWVTEAAPTVWPDDARWYPPAIGSSSLNGCPVRARNRGHHWQWVAVFSAA